MPCSDYINEFVGSGAQYVKLLHDDSSAPPPAVEITSTASDLSEVFHTLNLAPRSSAVPPIDPMAAPYNGLQLPWYPDAWPGTYPNFTIKPTENRDPVFTVGIGEEVSVERLADGLWFKVVVTKDGKVTRALSTRGAEVVLTDELRDLLIKRLES